MGQRAGRLGVRWSHPRRARSAAAEEDRADVTLAITNGSEYGWRGSVQLELDDIDIPIDIGEIGSGETATDEFELRLDEGSTYEIEGDLLIGVARPSGSAGAARSSDGAARRRSGRAACVAGER